MQPTSVRIPPLSLADATEEQAKLMGQWSSMHWVSVLANHPPLFTVSTKMIQKVIPNSDLPLRDREILVFRTLQLCDETYELTHHLLLARNVGMTDADIAAARTATGDLAPFDRSLIRAAEELVSDQRIGDQTWQELSERYTDVQLMEVVLLVATYVLIAMMTKSFGIAVEDDETFNNFMTMRKYVQRERGQGATPDEEGQ